MKRTMKIVSCLLALLILLGCVPMAVTAEDSETTYPLAEYAESVKLVGRTDVTTTAIVPHTTASGIAFYSDCSGDIELMVKGQRNLFDAQYFIVYVDGEMHKRVELNHRLKNRSVTDTLTVCEDLEPGMHRIEILRETEEINAYCEFVSITLNGTMTPLLDAPMLIEFVGDSITTGYGAYPFSYADEGDPIDYPVRQAGTKSYAYLTAKELGMDIQVCCTSGYGAEVGWNTDGVNMQDMYEKTAFHHNRENEWAFERTADIVVINLGTNDSSAARNKGVRDATVLAGMKNLINIVRERNPDAKIVWATGMMGICYRSGLQTIIEDLGGAENGYYYVELPRGTSGGAGHPNEEEHRAAADALIEFLETTVLGEEYASQYVTVDEMQDLIDKSGKAPADVLAIAQAELNTARATGATYSGTMTAAYRALEEQSGASGNIFEVIVSTVATWWSSFWTWLQGLF